MSTEFKDHFSKQSSEYANYRPTYPKELFFFLSSLVSDKEIAWDCATGSGQAALELANFFETVIASDASAKQIESAQSKPNIQYHLFPAEKTTLADNSVHLVTVAQAIHWFDFEKFYLEVKRVLKPGGIIAVWGYGLHNINPEIDFIVKNFYSQIVGSFWPKERIYIEQEYNTIPFPFILIPTPTFSMSLEWNLKDLLGYLRTWSSVQRYIDERKENPILLIEEELKPIWGNEEDKKKVSWPLYLKVGKN
jgi:SAM-dependent methyltransferase